jgi:hypothetical protein
MFEVMGLLETFSSHPPPPSKKFLTIVELVTEIGPVNLVKLAPGQVYNGQIESAY